jgi:thiol:disulfide interchange protein DsbA
MTQKEANQFIISSQSTQQGKLMTKRRAKMIQQQKIIVGAVAIVVLAIVGYFMTLVVAENNLDEFIEGEHYTLIADPRRIRGDKIEVMEFFSYGCIHCYNFDDEVKSWASDRTETVNFVQTPAVANEVWRNYGRAFYAMEDLGLLEDNHTLMFRQVHDAKRNLQTPQDFAEVLATGNISESQFVSAFTAATTNQKLARADQLSRRLRVATVPSIVVQGKYLVRVSGSVGFSRMLDVVDYLIAKEIAAKSAPAAS